MAAAAGVANADPFVLAGNGKLLKWGELTYGTGASVTYSFMAPGVTIGAHGNNDEFPAEETIAFDDFMAAGWKQEIERAFEAWSAVANITFSEAGIGEVGDIRFGNHSWPSGKTSIAHAFFPPQAGSSGPANGDIHFRTNGVNWVIGFAGPGRDIFQVAAHEIGHAIGLAHAADPTQLMSGYKETFVGPQAGDIAGAQFIYGPAIPEPGTIALVVLGVLALGIWRRRRSWRRAVTSAI